MRAASSSTSEPASGSAALAPAYSAASRSARASAHGAIARSRNWAASSSRGQAISRAPSPIARPARRKPVDPRAVTRGEANLPRSRNALYSVSGTCSVPGPHPGGRALSAKHSALGPASHNSDRLQTHRSLQATRRRGMCLAASIMSTRARPERFDSGDARREHSVVRSSRVVCPAPRRPDCGR